MPMHELDLTSYQATVNTKTMNAWQAECSCGWYCHSWDPETCMQSWEQHYNTYQGAFQAKERAERLRKTSEEVEELMGMHSTRKSNSAMIQEAPAIPSHIETLNEAVNTLTGKDWKSKLTAIPMPDRLEMQVLIEVDIRMIERLVELIYEAREA